MYEFIKKWKISSEILKFIDDECHRVLSKIVTMYQKII